MSLELAEQQRRLVALIKNRPLDPHADPYLAAVAASSALSMVREIGMWWSGFAIEQWCPLTSAALRAADRFDSEIELFAADPALPAALVPLSTRFLDRCGADADPLVASVAQFEAAVRIATDGSTSIDVVIEWDRDPEVVLDALTSGDRPDGARAGYFRTRVSTALPELVELL